MLSKLGLHPTLHDGSGLSHSNRTTPREVESLLGHMNSNRSFTGSLAVAGRTGTLADRMRKGAAAGRCFGKTGTLIKVTALVGYCPVPEGGRVAFAIMMDGTTPEKGRPRQDRIVQALARWHRPAGWR